MPMAMVLRTHTLSQTRGFLKALIGPDDRVLGFTAFGAEASELMAVAQTAMIGGIPYTVLRDTIWTHPTAAEGLLGLFANPPATPPPEPPVSSHSFNAGRPARTVPATAKE
jgi:pyruvate/2-oxoglutarate dehydrogenase complex dihydrolipoamide dehydrogenase (E3) component